MKEALLLLCLLCFQHHSYISYIVLLLGLGPSFLLAFLSSSSVFPGSLISNYLFYSLWGNLLILFLDHHVITHVSHCFPSMVFVILWLIGPLFSSLFLFQHYSFLEGNYQRWLWIISWWVQDGFLFVLGSSGLIPWWTLILSFSTYLLIPWESFALGALGLPWFSTWWVNVVVQCQVLLFFVEGGVLFFIFTSALVLIASWLS